MTDNKDTQTTSQIKKTGKEISAGFIIFKNTKDGPKFLLLYDRGRDWNFPRGKLSGGERSFQAAFRETQEETGLKRQDLKVKRGFKAYERFAFQRRQKKIFKTVIFYLAETRKKQVHLSDEHDGFGWFLYQDAMKLVRSFKDRETVLRQANGFIGRLHSQPRRSQPYRKRKPHGRRPEQKS